MLRENDIKVVRKIFEQHHYVMSTAEILKAKLYYQLSTMLAAFCSRRISEKVIEIGVWRYADTQRRTIHLCPNQF